MARARAREERRPSRRPRRGDDGDDRRRARRTARTRCPSSGRDGSTAGRRRASTRRARACCVTMCFVTWSATTAATATAARPAHCHGPAAERALGDRDRRRARPSTSRPGRRRAALRRSTRPGAGRRCRARAHGIAREPVARRSACRRPRRCRTCRPRSAASAASISSSVCCAPSSSPWSSSRSYVALAVSARWLSAPPRADLAELVLERARVLAVQDVDGMREPCALVEQALAELVGRRSLAVRSGAARCSERGVRSRRDRARSARSILSREECPETISMSRAGRPSVSASRRTTAAFALPPSASGRDPHLPARSVAADDARFEAPGATRSCSRVESVTPSRLPPGEVAARPRAVVLVGRVAGERR